MVPCTLDITFAVSKPAARMINPRECDARDALQVLRYLHTYAGRGILFPYASRPFVTSKLCRAGDKGLRHPKHGGFYLTTLYNGDTISAWYSGHRDILALSSTEAEYIAISNVAYLRHLLEHIGRPEQSPIVIADDNRGSIE